MPRGRPALRSIGAGRLDSYTSLMAYRLYCRIAAGVFALFTVYPVATKLLDGRLAHDWAHSVLHLFSAVAATYAGWLARSVVPAVLFTWGVGTVYLLLGAFGWFTDGLF
jgi:hypothetical protein